MRSLGEELLVLLVEQHRYGYELHARHEEVFGQRRPVLYGQLYATLKRLERDNLVTRTEESSPMGPSRAVFHATAEGHRRQASWLANLPHDCTRESVMRRAILTVSVETSAAVTRQRLGYYIDVMQNLDTGTEVNRKEASSHAPVFQYDRMLDSAAVEWLRRLMAIAPS